MSGGGKKSKKGEAKGPAPPSKLVKIECRVCSLELLLRNYEWHLQLSHPEEDSSDLRDKRARKMSSFFPNKERMHSGDSGVGEVEQIEAPVESWSLAKAGESSSIVVEEEEELDADKLLEEETFQNKSDEPFQTLEELAYEVKEQPCQESETKGKGVTNDDIMKAVQEILLKLDKVNISSRDTNSSQEGLTKQTFKLKQNPGRMKKI